MGASKDAELRSIAAGQDSQFATRQAAAVGLNRNDLSRLRRRGEIASRRLGVWRFTAAEGAADEAVTAALACWPDAVISHHTAAVFHGIQRPTAGALPEITIPHGEVRDRPGIHVHWSRDLPPEHIVRRGAIGYTSVARTVCDLADPSDIWATLALLDDAVAAGARRTWVHHCACAMVNGRGGVRYIRDATSKRAEAEFRSWLERAAAYVYRAGGLPDPQWNVRVRDQAGSIGIVDALWLPERVVSEKEGLRFHTTPAQRRRDAQRFNRLQDAEYRPRRFTWEDVVHRPVDVVETLHRALNAAGANLDPARIPRKIVLPMAPYR